MRGCGVFGLVVEGRELGLLMLMRAGCRLIG